MRARSITLRPVTQISAIWAACDPTASTAATTTPLRYGRRKETRRENVRRYGTALTFSECSYALLCSSDGRARGRGASRGCRLPAAAGKRRLADATRSRATPAGPRSDVERRCPRRWAARRARPAARRRRALRDDLG